MLKLFKSKLFITVIAIGIIFTSLAAKPMKVEASSYELEDYEVILREVNATFNQHFAITDNVIFAQNIVNKVTPSDFKQILINNCQQDLPKEYDIKAEILPHLTRAGRNEIVNYTADISHGNWQSSVNARIETTFFDNSSSKFVRYIDGGSLWNSSANIWLFRVSSVNCTSFSSTTCKVSYKGVWAIPSTGVADLTQLTYNITYYAR